MVFYLNDTSAILTHVRLRRMLCQTCLLGCNLTDVECRLLSRGDTIVPWSVGQLALKTWVLYRIRHVMCLVSSVIVECCIHMCVHRGACLRLQVLHPSLLVRVDPYLIHRELTEPQHLVLNQVCVLLVVSGVNRDVHWPHFAFPNFFIVDFLVNVYLSWYRKFVYFFFKLVFKFDVLVEVALFLVDRVVSFCLLGVRGLVERNRWPLLSAQGCLGSFSLVLYRVV